MQHQAKLKTHFCEKYWAEKPNTYQMHLTDEADLGTVLPEGERKAAAQLATSKDKEGWLITLDYPKLIFQF